MLKFFMKHRPKVHLASDIVLWTFTAIAILLIVFTDKSAWEIVSVCSSFIVLAMALEGLWARLSSVEEEREINRLNAEIEKLKSTHDEEESRI